MSWAYMDASMLLSVEYYSWCVVLCQCGGGPTIVVTCCEPARVLRSDSCH